MNYYNYKLDEALELDVCKYNTLVKLMYINEARDTLKGFEVSSYPKLKDQHRKDAHKRLYRIAYPSNFEHKNVVKLGDLSKVLK